MAELLERTAANKRPHRWCLGAASRLPLTLFMAKHLGVPPDKDLLKEP
jgi:hypothetical protein